jgi:predicted ArsR family transcriptional regulator
MQATRKQILDYLRRHRQATVRELSATLGLTATGIRQHLTVLERDGLVEAHEERGHVGRPALVYCLTEQGDGIYPKKYDQLANLLLEEVREMAGAQGLQTVLRRVAARLAEPYIDRVEGKTLPERVSETREIIRDRGCLADFENEGGDWLIMQHTCPFPNVASRNSSVCALDVEFVRQLVGADARLIKSLLRDDDSCTYRIRLEQPASARKR